MAEAANAHTPPKTPSPATSGPLASLEAWLYEMLVFKAPFQLPKDLTDFIVKYGPWITLVIGVLSLPAVLAVIGFGTLVGGIAGAYGVATGPFYWLSMLALIAQIAVMFISVPMLLKRQRQGWLLIFYANILSVAYSVLSSFGSSYSVLGGLIGAAIGFVIGMYILFQIRSYYTK